VVACKATYGRFMFTSHLQNIMTAQAYITAELEKLKQPIVHHDIGDTPLEEAILARVLSKKFRKLKVDQDTIDFCKESIRIAISENGPLSIGCVHGGTKLWRFDEYPEVDWAELFNMVYYAKWMRYIAEVYEPGVVLEYFSMDVVQQRLNNLPRLETDQYSTSFEKIIDWIKQYLPHNIRFTYRRYGDAYKDLSEYDQELDVAMATVSDELSGKLPVLTEEQRYMTELNVRVTPEQEKDPLWREKNEHMHLAVERTKAMDDYVNDKRFVPVCPTPWPGVIATGSTKKSFAKFWYAVGALERSGDGYNQIVLTPKQLKAAKFDLEDVELADLSGKNFSSIRVLK
jgi:hypothetical protein